MIKAVIFDIGGVTVRNPMSHIYNVVGKKFGINWTRIKREDEKLDPLIETNRISSKEFWLRLSKELRISDVNSLEKEWMNSFRKNAVLNKGVVKIIKRVKKEGYKVAAISNTMTRHEKLHRKFGHYKFFDQVFLSSRLGMEKPDSGIYRYCIKKLHVKPGECVFIDDNLKNVIGARKVGMKAILFKGTGQLGKDLKKYL